MNTNKIAKSFAYNIQKPVHHRVYGYVDLGEWRTVLDYVHVQLIDTTFVLVHESRFGSTGGIGKDVVLYAVGRKGRKEVRRRVITDQFDRRRDCITNWDLDKISVKIVYVVTDKNFEHSGSYVREQEFRVYVNMADTKSRGIWAEHIRKSFVEMGGTIFMGPFRVYEDEVLIKKKVENIDDDRLFSKKRVRRLLQQWGLPGFSVQ